VLDDVLGFGFGGPFIYPQGVANAPVMTGWIVYSSADLELQGSTIHSQTFGIAPSIDVFVTSGFSIGAAVTGYYAISRQPLENGSMSSTTIGGTLRPRIGWSIPLGSRFALWPRASVAIGASHSSDVPTTSVDGMPSRTDSTNVSWAVGGEAMFVAPVMRPLAFVLGPTIGYGKSDVVTGESSTLASTRVFSVGARGGISLVF
jgi:hypothetical protein